MSKSSVSTILIFFVFLGILAVTNTLASVLQNNDNLDKGSIVLRELLLAHQLLANSKPSNIDNKKITGSVVLIGQKKYEVVSFNFENTQGNFLDETFEEYVKTNNLFYMKSTASRSQEGTVILEIFDSSRSNLDNDISFNITLRPLNIK